MRYLTGLVILIAASTACSRANDRVAANSGSVGDDDMSTKPGVVVDVDAARRASLVQHRDIHPVVQVIAADEMWSDGIEPQGLPGTEPSPGGGRLRM